MHYLLLCQYTLIAIVLRVYNAAFYAIANFDLFNDGSVDLQMWVLLTKSEFRVFDTQVAIKACGPLILFQSGNL